MKVKTNELSGNALNWAVAKCENIKLTFESGNLWFNGSLSGYEVYNPSSNWAQGGPIIEIENIEIRPTLTEGGYRTSNSQDAVSATILLPNGATALDIEKVVFDYGPTPLIAAMRCYVASKFGETVDIPEELL
jgi:hypothetical protein